MARKGKPAKSPKPKKLTEAGAPNEDPAFTTARTVLRPTVQAAFTLKEYGKTYGELDLAGLIYSLNELTRASNAGDLSRAEAMLTTQAHTLDAIFNNLAQRAITAEYMDNLDRYLKLSLRAQSQCRATLEALANIKNPPALGYVHQANIAHGPQQVNNTPTSPGDASGAPENPNLQNKLLEKSDGKRLDAGTASTAGRTDSAMATVGARNGSKDSGR